MATADGGRRQEIIREIGVSKQDTLRQVEERNGAMKLLTGLAAAGVLCAGLGGGLLVMWALAGESGQAPGSSGRDSPSLPQVTTAGLPDSLVTLRIQFGSKMTPSGPERTTEWNGQLSVAGGQVHAVRLWQPGPGDRVDGARWTLITRRDAWWVQEELEKGHEPPPPPASMLIVELAQATPDTRLSIQTAQGDFEFTLKDAAIGAPPLKFLDDRVQVARAADAATILSAPTEDDFPSAAVTPDGKLYVAYVAFTHGKDFRRRAVLPEEPKSLDFLAEPTGGDQVLLLEGDGRRWTGPLAVTPPGEDVFRTATAVDGSGRVWVFWTAKAGGAWGLSARRLDKGRWSDVLRLTSPPGPDMFPAAATDNAGRVWVAWQSFRGDHSVIVVARQEGEKFGEPVLVADPQANAWTPAIAAARDGRVAVAWDTYAKGDYDVYCREWSGGKFGPTVPVATSLEAEMRPSVAYDAAGRLWIAYEKSPENWGKDFGGLVKKGMPLFRGRSIAVRIWAEERLWEPAEDPAVAMAPDRLAAPRQGLMVFTRKTWLDIYGDPLTAGPRLAAPRLTADATGRVWLAVRSPAFGTRTPVGSSWFEHLAWYEGGRWSAQIVCPRTDNLLDSRPALAVRPSGEVVLFAASDGRSSAPEAAAAPAKGAAGKGGKAKGKADAAAPAPAPVSAPAPAAPSPWPDPVKNELVMARVKPPAGAPAAAELKALAPVGPGQAPAAAVKEKADVARVRAARASVGGKTLRVARGEFHRHTEISFDGANDGMLMDMWRYALDAASLDWVGNGDHDNGEGREYPWWIIQKTTDLFAVAGAFTPMFTYERSVGYPDGHRNVVFAQRGVRTLPRLRGGLGKAMDELPPEAGRPNSPDTLLLYRYLAQFDGVCASHTSGTNMGTDWRDNSAKVEPIVEIYQGCRQNYEQPDAPRAPTAEYTIGGWRPLGFVSLALKKGYRLGFQSSSDHISTHISFCNCWVEELTREGILAAMKARHVYGATDHIVGEFRCGERFMGDEFTLNARPTLKVRLAGTGPFAKVHVIKDGNYVYTHEPGKAEVEFEWTDTAAQPGSTCYYYIRGEQADGELVWLSPMWITYKP
jgi:hypothetical protein